MRDKELVVLHDLNNRKKGRRGLHILASFKQEADNIPGCPIAASSRDAPRQAENKDEAQSTGCLLQ